jgi:hypothetical protein
MRRAGHSEESGRNANRAVIDPGGSTHRASGRLPASDGQTPERHRFA